MKTNGITDELILILLNRVKLVESKLGASKEIVTKLQYKCATYKRRIAKLKTPKVVGKPLKAKDSQGGYFVPGPFSVPPVSKSELCKDKSNYAGAKCKPKVFTNPPDIHEGHIIAVLGDGVGEEIFTNPDSKYVQVSKAYLLNEEEPSEAPGIIDEALDGLDEAIKIKPLRDAIHSMIYAAEGSVGTCGTCKFNKLKYINIDQEIYDCFNKSITNASLNCVGAGYKYWESKS